MKRPMRDIRKNRQARKWSRSELLGRAAWALAHPFFALSPRVFWGWRRLILKCFGARVGSGVHIHPGVKIAIPWNLTIGKDSAIGEGARVYNLGPLAIGERATISQYVHLCGGTHDHACANFTLVKSPISIGDDAWICADAFIGPGVEIGHGSIVGARAVVVKNVASNLAVAGNPARVIRSLKEDPACLSLSGEKTGSIGLLQSSVSNPVL